MDTKERFALDTAEHKMTILHEDGLYRHLRFKKPKTGMYWFDIITWPGALAIRGDMGNYVFARLDDMFEFFRGHAVNEQYWAEKMIAGPDPMEYDIKRLSRLVMEYVKETDEVENEEERERLMDAVKQEILFDERAEYSENEAQCLVRDFAFPLKSGSTFQFYDTWGWSMKEYTLHFRWCLHAIVYAIQTYDTAKKDHEAKV